MDEMNELFEASQDEEAVLLPLFPLRLVLFPGQVLPLHVFEPRYRMMINRCIGDQRPFGIVLLRDDIPDWRMYQGDIGLPHDVGTTAHIRQVERLRDGRLNIITVGLHRFRIRQLQFDEPYLQAMVESFPLLPSEEEPTRGRVLAVHRGLKTYVQLLTELTQADIDLDEVPQDPRTLAFLTATALQIPWEDKQELLGKPGLSALLDAEQALLARETMLLRFMHVTQEQVEQQPFGPSGYLYPN